MKNQINIGFWDWNLNKEMYINLFFEKQDKIKDLILKKERIEKQLTDATNEFLAKKEKYEANINKLQNLLVDKTQRVYDLENAIADRNKEIQELHYELSKIKLKLDKKIKAFNKVRGSIGGYQKQINKLRKELELSKNKINFLETRVPKKSFEDLKAYEFGRREVLRRNKEVRNEKV